MSTSASTPETLALRELLDTHQDAFRALLVQYGATNPRLFGPVACGNASPGIDVDILVHMEAKDGNLLMRASGLLEETRRLYERDDIDVFPAQLLKEPISKAALKEAVVL